LVSQMQRCSVSIPSNIAEGYKRKGVKEFLQFLSIAEGSAAELETQLLISRDIYPEIDCVRALALLIEVQKMLYAMSKSLSAKRSTLSANKGFTLIEFIVYIAILGLIISGFVSYSLSISSVRNKNYSASTVQANGRSAIGIITRKIHEAESIVLPGASASSTVLILDMPSTDPDITFLVSDGVLYMGQIGLATTTITDRRTQVSSLVFSNLASSGERSNIQIEMTIGYNVPAGDVGFGFTKSYRTAVSTRI